MYSNKTKQINYLMAVASLIKKIYKFSFTLLHYAILFFSEKGNDDKTSATRRRPCIFIVVKKIPIPIHYP